MRSPRFAVQCSFLAAAVWTVAAAVGEPGPAAAERRAAIEAVMRRMEAATVAADAKAYIALVDPGDSEFLHEQIALTGDWSRLKPASIALSIVDGKELPAAASAPAAAPAAEAPPSAPGATDGTGKEEPVKPAQAPAGRRAPRTESVDVGPAIEPSFEDSRAEFRMKTVWKMEGWERPRTLSVPVVFVRDAEKGWRYAGEKWDTVAAPASGAFRGVRVLYEPENTRHKEIAEKIVAGMPEVRSVVDAHFKMNTPGVVTIKLYQSMLHLQASIWLGYTDSLGGWNEPRESMKVLARSSYDGMKKTIAHEYGHCVTFHMGDKATDAPWWVLEGSADLAAATYRGSAARSRDNAVRGWARKNELAPWDKIEKFPLPDEYRKFMGHVYTQGEHMMAFIDARYGAEARIAFLRSLFAGKTTDQAAREGLGMPWSDVDAAWRHSVEQQLTTEPKDDK
ncbi:MAG TPA: hypothetical protein VEB22_03600 [Phycisphaerales bacterium]|nr:hypothetical protein [Phycisphaerales bacterium]